MPSGNSTFRRNDVKRAVLAVASAGLPIGGVEFRPNGLIVVYTEKHQTAFPTEFLPIAAPLAAVNDPVQPPSPSLARQRSDKEKAPHPRCHAPSATKCIKHDLAA